VQCFNGHHKQWTDLEVTPIWDNSIYYRVKPEPKPDVVMYHGVDNWRGIEGSISGIMSEDLYCFEHWDNQVRITFDGETGKFKSVELVK